MNQEALPPEAGTVDNMTNSLYTNVIINIYARTVHTVYCSFLHINVRFCR